MLRWVIRIFVGLFVLVCLFAAFAVWKPNDASKLIWPQIENVLLRQPFVGITEDGTPEEGLFPIRATGVSTQPIVAAARTLIESLSDEQRDRLMFPVDDLEWRRWANIHLSARQGVGFLEMDNKQSTAAFILLATSLSPRGFKTAVNIMRLEGHLADLLDNHEQYGEKRYWLTIMGRPSEVEPWGWQIDGHHLVINFFVMGDQVVMTPTFMGSEPPMAKSGPHEGTSILEEELSEGLALINMLSADQKAVAIISREKTDNNNHGELFSDNAIVPYEGIKISDLSPPQQTQARRLIRLYTGQMPPGHAAFKMTEILRHWDRTYFSWVGATDPDAVFYYRIHSPVVMIEYDHQKPIALDGPDRPSRNHVHTVVRTPNGNDYGKDLLRQHLEEHPH